MVATRPNAYQILEIEPTHIHQRTPLVVGSMAEMHEFEACT